MGDINATETTSTGKSFAITPDAFKNENHEICFYNDFYFAFVSKSKAFFCFYISNIIK